MTTNTYTFTHTDSVSIISGPEGLALLRADLQTSDLVFGWAYLIDPDFFALEFRYALANGQVQFLVDDRQRPAAARLAATFENFHARSWSTNRTLHDKTLILPNLNTLWISSYNLTAGSWTMSYNRAARLTSEQIALRVYRDFEEDWSSAKPVLPKE